MSRFKVGDHVEIVGYVGSYGGMRGELTEIDDHEYMVKLTDGREVPFTVEEIEPTEASVTVGLDKDGWFEADLAAGGFMDGDGNPATGSVTFTPVKGFEADPTPNRRAQVLRTAESLVNGARADDYGPPQENFGRVAAMWSAQFAAKLKEPLTADEIAIALVHLKLSRLANTPDHADSFIDAAGYIALAAEIAEAAL